MAEPPDDWRQHPDWWERWQAQIQAEHERGEWRERWRQEATWKAAELATLCCGWSPDSDALPPRDAFVGAIEKIIRAVEVGDLVPVQRPESLLRHFFFGSHPYLFELESDDAVLPIAVLQQPPVLFRVRDAISWAAPRFQAFPFKLSSEAIEIAGARSTKNDNVLPFPIAAAVPRPPSPRAVGQVLRGYFRSCGLTLEQLAEQVNMHESSVKRHFAGHSSPRPKAMAAYLAFFNRHLKLDPPLDVLSVLTAAGDLDRARLDEPGQDAR